MKYALVAGFMATIVAANWAITTFGVVPVGFGLYAPAGVFAAGLAFTFRDLLHEWAGRWWVVAAILGGAALSFGIEGAGRVALASGAAFLVSEFADYAVYSRIRTRSWLGAVGASNTVGLVVDSALFLFLAFGSLAFLGGQVLGKGYMTLAAIVTLGVLRGHLLPRNAPASVAGEGGGAALSLTPAAGGAQDDA